MCEQYIELLTDDVVEKLIKSAHNCLEDCEVSAITSEMIIAHANIKSIRIDDRSLEVKTILTRAYSSIVNEALTYSMNQGKEVENGLKLRFSTLVNKYQLCKFLENNQEYFTSTKLSTFDSMFIHKVKLLKSVMITEGIVKEQLVNNMFEV